MSAVCLPYVRRVFAVCPPTIRHISAVCPPYFRCIFGIPNRPISPFGTQEVQLLKLTVSYLLKCSCILAIWPRRYTLIQLLPPSNFHLKNSNLNSLFLQSSLKVLVWQPWNSVTQNKWKGWEIAYENFVKYLGSYRIFQNWKIVPSINIAIIKIYHTVA